MADLPHYTQDLAGVRIVMADGTELPLAAVLNFKSGLSASYNSSTKRIDVDVSGGGGGSYQVQNGTDANTTAEANKLLSMPAVSASRTISLPAAPTGGMFVVLRVTNGFTWDHVVNGNGKNINDGSGASASTYTIANDGAIFEFVFVSSLNEWVIL